MGRQIARFLQCVVKRATLGIPMSEHDRPIRSFYTYIPTHQLESLEREDNGSRSPRSCISTADSALLVVCNNHGPSTLAIVSLIVAPFRQTVSIQLRSRNYSSEALNLLDERQRKKITIKQLAEATCHRSLE